MLQISARLPVDLVELLDAEGARQGKNRTETLIEILRKALDPPVSFAPVRKKPRKKIKSQPSVVLSTAPPIGHTEVQSRLNREWHALFDDALKRQRDVY